MKVVQELFIMRRCLKLVEKKESKDMKFLREFSSISVASVCREQSIDNSNIYKTGKKADKVKNEIDKRIIKLYANYLQGDEDE